MKLEALKKILSQNSSGLKDRGVKSLKVFGSVARGESREGSDIDMLVEFDDRPVGLLEFIELKQHLEELLGSHVDLVTSSALKRQLKEKIQSEAILVA